MMQFWVNKGIEGFRMDVINFLSKDPALPDGILRDGQAFADGQSGCNNGPRIHEYLQEMYQEVVANASLMTVSEVPFVIAEEAKLYTASNRNELNWVLPFEQLDLDCQNGDKWHLKKLDLVVLKENFKGWQQAPHEGFGSLYLNHHDQPHLVSRFGNDGQYLEKCAKMLATCLHFMQGTPYIFQGKEI